MTRNRAMTVRTVDLGYEQLLVLEHPRGARVRVLQGGVWLTEEGRTEDVFVERDRTVALQTKGRALLEGLGPTRIEVAEPVRPRPWHALTAGWMPGARAALRTVEHLWPQALAASRATLAAAGLIVGIAIPTLVVVGMTQSAVTVIAHA